MPTYDDIVGQETPPPTYRDIIKTSFQNIWMSYTSLPRSSSAENISFSTAPVTQKSKIAPNVNLPRSSSCTISSTPSVTFGRMSKASSSILSTIRTLPKRYSRKFSGNLAKTIESSYFEKNKGISKSQDLRKKSVGSFSLKASSTPILTQTNEVIIFPPKDVFMNSTKTTNESSEFTDIPLTDDDIEIPEVHLIFKENDAELGIIKEGNEDYQTNSISKSSGNVSVSWYEEKCENVASYTLPLNRKKKSSKALPKTQTNNIYYEEIPTLSHQNTNSESLVLQNPASIRTATSSLILNIIPDTIYEEE